MIGIAPASLFEPTMPRTNWRWSTA